MKKFWVSKQSLLDSALVLLGGIILCYMGFYNSFPFVYSDCGTYIGSGFDLIVPYDRPIFYGLFVRHISLATSLWLVIWVQGIVVSLILFYYFKYFTTTERFRIYYLAFIFLITFFSSASFHVSQLIPDIFTSMAILCTGLLLFAGMMKKRDRIITYFILFWAIAVHNSHFIIVLILLFIYTIVFIYRKYRKNGMALTLSGEKLLLSWGVLLCSYLLICTINFSLNAGFGLSRSGSIFLVSRFNEMGLLKPFLKENCLKHNYRLCNYKESIPSDILWDYQKSPFYKCGGWTSQQVRDEYKTIAFDLLTTPKYGHLYIVKSIESGIKQFFVFSFGAAPPQVEGSTSYGQIYWHYTTSIPEYMGSRQNTQTMNYYFINEFHKYTVCFFLFISLVFLFYPSFAHEYYRLFLFILAGLLVNAFVCGALSTVTDRYQSRVVWLLPLPVFLVMANKEFFLKKVRKLILSNNKSTLT